MNRRTLMRSTLAALAGVVAWPFVSKATTTNTKAVEPGGAPGTIDVSLTKEHWDDRTIVVETHDAQDHGIHVTWVLIENDRGAKWVGLYDDRPIFVGENVRIVTWVHDLRENPTPPDWFPAGIVPIKDALRAWNADRSNPAAGA